MGVFCDRTGLQNSAVAAATASVEKLRRILSSSSSPAAQHARVSDRPLEPNRKALLAVHGSSHSNKGPIPGYAEPLGGAAAFSLGEMLSASALNRCRFQALAID